MAGAATTVGPVDARLAHRTGAALAAGYLATVSAIAVARSAGVGPHLADVASSPASVLSGQLWRLVTSGFVVAGEPVVQLVAATVVVVMALAALGPGAFWRAALAGHVGATLLAYAGVAVLWVVARGDVDGVVHAPDYGISCVWAGAVGLLAGAAVGGRRRATVLCAAVAAAPFVLVVGIGDGLAGAEHALALVLGAVVGVRTRPHAAASPRRA